MFFSDERYKNSSIAYDNEKIQDKSYDQFSQLNSDNKRFLHIHICLMT